MLYSQLACVPAPIEPVSHLGIICETLAFLWARSFEMDEGSAG
jgi:hypothetical protein